VLTFQVTDSRGKKKTGSSAEGVGQTKTEEVNAGTKSGGEAEGIAASPLRSMATIFPIPDISRAEVAAAARRRAMKLYYGTANGPQRSGCGRIGLPEG
jgi:hypothetical protein